MDEATRLWAAAAIGFISALLVKVIGEWASTLAFGPKLEMSFSHEKHAIGYVVLTKLRHTKTAELRFGNLPLQRIHEIYETPTYHVRVRVRNSKSRTARNCCAYLVAIQKQNERGRFLPVSYHDSIPLLWSYGSGPTADIPGGVNLHFDVFATLESSTFIQPRLSSMPHQYEEFFMENGVFIYDIVLTADGIRAARISLKVEWNGQWDNFTVTRHD